MTRRQYLLLVVPLMAVLIGFGAVLLLDAAAGGPDVAWDPGLQRTVLEAVSREFAGPIDERLEWRAFFNMLNAYLGTFDEYGEVVPPWEVARERERSEGRYGGVGIRVEARPAEGPVEYLEIVGLKSGGPAAEAGARRGDRIVAIDGRGVGDLYGKRRPTRSWDPAAAAVRGEAETAVELTRDRPGAATRVVRVVRAWVDHGSVF
ncbi:MAG: PDZ domain-containing protein, partial [Planctomycetota bacterium]